MSTWPSASLLLALVMFSQAAMATTTDRPADKDDKDVCNSQLTTERWVIGQWGKKSGEECDRLFGSLNNHLNSIRPSPPPRDSQGLVKSLCSRNFSTFEALLTASQNERERPADFQPFKPTTLLALPATECLGRLQLVFILDMSGSVDKVTFDGVYRGIVEKLTGKLTVGRSQVGLITFPPNDLTVELQEPQGAKNQISKLSHKATGNEEHNLGDAFIWAAGQLNHQSAANPFDPNSGDVRVVLVISDGLLPWGEDQTDPMIQGAKKGYSTLTDLKATVVGLLVPSKFKGTAKPQLDQVIAQVVVVSNDTDAFSDQFFKDRLARDDYSCLTPLFTNHTLRPQIPTVFVVNSAQLDNYTQAIAGAEWKGAYQAMEFSGFTDSLCGLYPLCRPGDRPKCQWDGENNCRPEGTDKLFFRPDCGCQCPPATMPPRYDAVPPAPVDDPEPLAPWQWALSTLLGVTLIIQLAAIGILTRKNEAARSPSVANA